MPVLVSFLTKLLLIFFSRLVRIFAREDWPGVVVATDANVDGVDKVLRLLLLLKAVLEETMLPLLALRDFIGFGVTSLAAAATVIFGSADSDKRSNSFILLPANYAVDIHYAPQEKNCGPDRRKVKEASNHLKKYERGLAVRTWVTVRGEKRFTHPS